MSWLEREKSKRTALLCLEIHTGLKVELDCGARSSWRSGRKAPTDTKERAEEYVVHAMGGLASIQYSTQVNRVVNCLSKPMSNNLSQE